MWPPPTQGAWGIVVRLVHRTLWAANIPKAVVQISTHTYTRAPGVGPPWEGGQLRVSGPLRASCPFPAAAMPSCGPFQWGDHAGSRASAGGKSRRLGGRRLVLVPIVTTGVVFCFLCLYNGVSEFLFLEACESHLGSVPSGSEEKQPRRRTQLVMMASPGL